jgi:hypothetical protein
VERGEDQSPLVHAASANGHAAAGRADAMHPPLVGWVVLDRLRRLAAAASPIARAAPLYLFVVGLGTVCAGALRAAATTEDVRRGALVLLLAVAGVAALVAVAEACAALLVRRRSGGRG